MLEHSSTKRWALSLLVFVFCFLSLGLVQLGGNSYSVQAATDSKLTRPPTLAASAGFSDGTSTQALVKVKIPVYRLLNNTNKFHLYSTSSNEVNTLVKQGWTYEKVAFKIYSPLFCSGNPVYRFYNKQNGDHLYTLDANEINVLKKATQVWNDEGVIGCAYPNNACYADPNIKPVYRLFEPTRGEHFYTMDTNERYILLTQRGFRDEGVGFQAFVDNPSLAAYQTRASC